MGIFSECNELEEVSFASCDSITDKAFQLRESRNCFSCESNMPFRKIRCIDLSGCHLLSSTTVRHLASMSGPYLKKVNLSWTNIDCSALLYLAGHTLPSAVFVATSSEGADKPFSNRELNKAQLFEFQSIYGASEAGISSIKALNSQHGVSDHEFCDESELLRGHDKSFSSQPQEDVQTIQTTLLSNNELCCRCPQTVCDSELSKNLLDFGSPSLLYSSSKTNKVASYVCETFDHPCDKVIAYNKRNDFGLSKSSRLDQCSVTGQSARVMSGGTRCHYCSCSICLPPAREDFPAETADESNHSLFMYQVQYDNDFKNSSNICNCFGHCSLMYPCFTTCDSSRERQLAVRGLSARTRPCSADITVECDDENSVEQCSVSFQDVSVSIASYPDVCTEDTSVIPVNIQSEKFDARSIEESLLCMERTQGKTPTPVLGTMLSQSCDKLHLSSDSSEWARSAFPISSGQVQCDNMQDFNPIPLYTSSIEELDISEINFYSLEMAESCLKMFSEANKQLKTLHISWKNLDDSLFESVISNQKGIRVLSLVDCETLSNAAIIALGKHCTEISAVDLKGVAFITDQGLQTLIVKGCRLQSLGLAESSISDVSLKRLARYCEKQLCRVDLSWCENITDSGIAHLIISCPNLRALDLRQCNASFKSFSALAKHVKCLCSLGLCGVESLTDRYAVPIFKNLVQLTDVDLSWNSSLTDETIIVLLTHCLLVRNVALAGLKRLTAKPFLPMISGMESWERLRLKITEDVVQNKGDFIYSRDIAVREAYHPDFFLPHRSYHYAPYVRRIDLSYCDKVNDLQLAEIIAVCRGTLNIDDYYGEPVRPLWNLL